MRFSAMQPARIGVILAAATAALLSLLAPALADGPSRLYLAAYECVVGEGPGSPLVNARVSVVLYRDESPVPGSQKVNYTNAAGETMFAFQYAQAEDRLQITVTPGGVGAGGGSQMHTYRYVQSPLPGASDWEFEAPAPPPPGGDDPTLCIDDVAGSVNHFYYAVVE